jgi:hypothetical protein
VLGSGQMRFTQGSAGHSERVDRVGLAADSDRLASSGHQPGWHPDHALTGGQQIAFQPAGDVPAVLDRPGPLGPARPGPADQVAVPEGAGRHGGLVQLTARGVNGDDSVGVLVRIHAQQHHACGLLCAVGDLGPVGGQASVGAVPRSSQATPVGPQRGHGGTT